MGINSEEITSYYNSWAPEYTEQYIDELQNKPLDCYMLDHFATLTNGKGKVCDIGCGPGHIAGYLAKKGANAFGIDLSEGMINEAKRHFPELDFYVANMLDLPVKDNQLAGLSAFYSIVHLEPTKIPLAVKEFRRVVKPNGYILLSFHVGREEIVRVNKKLGGNEVVADFVFHNYQSVIQCIEDRGFDLTEAFIRYPYHGVEYQSHRAYILARKKGGFYSGCSSDT